MTQYDVAIIGAGIAGASLAAEIAPHASVLLIEGETHPGYHATGRSAAFWQESYGGPLIQPLTTASGPVLAAGGFLRPRGALYIGRAEDEPAIAAFERDYAGSGVVLERVEGDQLRAQIPGLLPLWDRAIREASCTDIDVAGLHQHYLAVGRKAGAKLICDSPLRAAERGADGWRLTAGSDTHHARLLVNAAGAWADDVARLAGAQPVGIQPYRRTIAQLIVDPPASATLPLILDINGRFYFKPEAGGRLWLSPHDETPSVACDVAPEDVDVATAIDRLGHVVDWRVERVEHRWAGLRSFAPDRLPVYGPDPQVPGFFWCAGQGGFGIQTSIAGARIAAALLLGHAPHASVAHIDPVPFAPDRFSL